MLWVKAFCLRVMQRFMRPCSGWQCDSCATWLVGASSSRGRCSCAVVCSCLVCLSLITVAQWLFFNLWKRNKTILAKNAEFIFSGAELSFSDHFITRLLQLSGLTFRTPVRDVSGVSRTSVFSVHFYCSNVWQAWEGLCTDLFENTHIFVFISLKKCY